MMKKLIFAFMQAYRGDERESLLLAHSLRKFGGGMADCPLWMMVPHGRGQVSETTHRALEELGVQRKQFDVPVDTLKFPYALKVYAAAAAEEVASGQADILVWMDSDTVFTGEPGGLVLKEKVQLGYRPVMLKNISSLYEDAVHPFWDFIFTFCHTPVRALAPMLTTVDKVRIRPHFNAGFLSVRPEKELLRTWRDNFERIYRQLELEPFYRKNGLYRIFIHQAVLAATALGLLEQVEMQDLGERYNIPTFLNTEADIACNALTLRYDEYSFFAQPGWENKIPLKEDVKKWLQAEVKR